MALPALANPKENEKAPVPVLKNPCAQEIMDYVKGLPQGFYTGFPGGKPIVGEKSRALAEKAWSYYGFDKHVEEHFNKKTAEAVHKSFVEEFTRTLHVNAGVLYFLNEKGPVEVTLGDGTKTTVKAADMTPDNLAESASFLAFNAAIFGRVGTTRQKELADSLFLHLVTSPANSRGDKDTNPFLADKNRDALDALRKIRPISKHEYSALGASINDAIKDSPELLKAYGDFKKSFEKYSPKGIYSSFLSNGYVPAAKGAGNVELLVWTVGSRAFSAINENFKPKVPDVPKEPEIKPADDTDKKKVPDIKPTLTPQENPPAPKIRHDGEVNKSTELESGVYGTVSIRKKPGDMLDEIPKVKDYFKFRKTWDGMRTELKPLGGMKSLSIDAAGTTKEFAMADLTSKESQQALAQAVATKMYLENKTSGTIAAVDKDGGKYDVKYDWVPQGAKDGKITIGIYSQGEATPMLNLDCTYSKTKSGLGVNEVIARQGTFNLANKDKTAQLYGSGSFAVTKNEQLQDGKFAIGLDMADANGKKMHVELSGADFNMEGFKYDSEHPLRSTFKLADGTVSIADLIADRQRGGKLKEIRRNLVQSGSISFDAEFEPASFGIRNLNVKGKGSGNTNTWSAENVSVGLNGISASFKDSEFKLNFGGDLSKGGMDFEWRANGKEILSFGLPQMTSAQLDGLKGASREFTKEIFANIGKADFYSTLRGATRNFMKEFKSDAKDARMELNLPGLLGAFNDDSWAGKFAKDGIAPGLLADAKNGGKLKFTLTELGRIAEIMGIADPKERWSTLGGFLAPKLGLVSGQAMVDNTIMGMYFGNFNVQKELIDQAQEGYSNLVAFAKRSTFGATSQSAIGANYFMPLNKMEKDDFALYSWATAALNTFNYSPFGKPADLSNINFMQKSFDVTSGIGSRYADMDFGLSATWSLLLEENLGAANQLKPGDSFMMALSDKSKNRFYGYAYARYKVEGGAGKLDVTFIGGAAPSAYNEYYARMDYDVMRFRAGVQLEAETAIHVTDRYFVMPRLSWNTPNLGNIGNSYFNAGFTHEFRLNDDWSMYNTNAVNGITAPGSPKLSPALTLGVKENSGWDVHVTHVPGSQTLAKWQAGVTYRLP